MERMEKKPFKRLPKKPKPNIMTGGLGDPGSKKRKRNIMTGGLDELGSKSSKKVKFKFADDAKMKPKKKTFKFQDDTTAKRKDMLAIGTGKNKKKKVVKKKTTVDFSKQGSPYKIKSGDTLSGIAKRRGTTVAKIMAANPSIKDKNKIIAGKSLKMPGIKNLMSKPTLRPSKRATKSKSILSAIKSSMPKSKVTKSKVTKPTIKGLDAKGNYKGTNIKPTKMQLDRLKKRK